MGHLASVVMQLTQPDFSSGHPDPTLPHTNPVETCILMEAIDDVQELLQENGVSGPERCGVV